MKLKSGQKVSICSLSIAYGILSSLVGVSTIICVSSYSSSSFILKLIQLIPIGVKFDCDLLKPKCGQNVEKMLRNGNSKTRFHAGYEL